MFSLRFPLVILALLSAIALLATLIAVFIAPFEYTGNLNFTYNEGTDSIIKIDFQFDQGIAESLVVVKVPSPWSGVQSGNTISMSGGNLAPEDALTVSVSFNRYVLPGKRPFTGIGTTSGGESIRSTGVLAVTEMIILKIIFILNQNQLYLIGGTFALFIVEILRRWKQKREVKAPKPKLGDEEIVFSDETNVNVPVPITEGGLAPKQAQDFTQEREKNLGSDTNIAAEDGDDPRDIPPPIMYGEEIDVDPNVPPVYVVSDFHVGSSRGIDKRKSNDMDYDTLKVFLKWLDSVDLDAANYDHYDVVMNGDFVDLWQAKRSKDDTNANRLKDILDSNNLFFSELAQILRRRYPRCRFYYLLGNHDDALFSSNDGSHYKARNSLKKYLRQDWHSQIIAGEGRVWSAKPNNKLMSIKIDKTYSNPTYKLHIEHGHRFDSFNWKGNKDKAVGQEIAEYINKMQELDPAFKNGEYTPNQEFVKHLVCLKKNKKTTKKILDIINKMESVAMKTSLKNSFCGAVGDGINYILRGDRSVLDHESVDPNKVREYNREKAKEIIDESIRFKIVVLGHTHFRDLRPNSGESNWATANTGTWLREIKASKDSKKCSLTTKPSPLPYVKISKEDGDNKALVELKFFRGNLRHRMVKVSL